MSVSNVIGADLANLKSISNNTQLVIKQSTKVLEFQLMPLMSHIQDIEQLSWRTTRGVAPHSASPWKLLSDRSETTCSMWVEWKRVGSCHRFGSFNKAHLLNKPSVQLNAWKSYQTWPYLPCESIRVGLCSELWFWVGKGTAHVCRTLVLIYCGTMLKTAASKAFPKRA